MSSSTPRRIAAPHVLNVEDLRRLAQKRLPRVVFEFLDGGAEDEITLAANRSAFETLSFRPRQAVALPQCDLQTKVLTFDLSFPALLAPVGCSRVMHREGEIAAARAAHKAGTGYILASASGHSLEDVSAGSTGPLWYQLYLVGGARGRRGCIGACVEIGVFGAGGHYRYSRWRHARARLQKRPAKASGKRTPAKDSFSAAIACPANLACAISSRWRHAYATQHHRSGTRTYAVASYERRPGKSGCYME